MSCFYPGLPAYLLDFSLTNIGGSPLKFRLKYSKKNDNFLTDIGLLFELMPI
jgi:hypothetical protein